METLNRPSQGDKSAADVSRFGGICSGPKHVETSGSAVRKAPLGPGVTKLMWVLPDIQLCSTPGKTWVFGRQDFDAAGKIWA